MVAAMSGKTSRLAATARISRCAGAGAVAAAILSAWVTIIVLFHPQAFAQLGASYAEVVAIYFVTFPLGGAFVGLLWPLCRFRSFAYPTTIITAWLLIAGVAVAQDGMPWKWGAASCVTVAGYGLIMGLFFGGSLRKAVLAHKLDLDSE